LEAFMITDTTPRAGYAVTLFSGLGSSSQALRSLGYEVLAHDFNADAVATLRANGFNAVQTDVREIDYSRPRYTSIDVLAGGPPCQPFSQSHDGDGRYDERDMIPEFIRAVDELAPKLFVMEEVQTLTWKRHADYLAQVIADLEELGYTVEGRVLNAADYGQPQARKRLFLVGVRDDIVRVRRDWGRPAISWLDKDVYTPVTMAEALGWDDMTCLFRNGQAPAPAHVFGADSEKCMWPLRRASTTVVGSFRPDVQAAPGYRKAGDGPRQNTPGSVVTTLKERLVLQGMPADWVVKGSKSAQDLQVGNSVPMPLIRDLIEVNAL
jgi:DNA (cytosine-5)-methyltransferase 1